MTDEQKPFIFVEFDEAGSSQYKISFNGVTASQLFLVAGLMQFQGNKTMVDEQLAYQKQKLAEPTKGIVKP